MLIWQISHISTVQSKWRLPVSSKTNWEGILASLCKCDPFFPYWVVASLFKVCGCVSLLECTTYYCLKTVLNHDVTNQDPKPHYPHPWASIYRCFCKQTFIYLQSSLYQSTSSILHVSLSHCTHLTSMYLRYECEIHMPRSNPFFLHAHMPAVCIDVCM